ncbi:MAG: MFS transporter [bacterium]|nr:MFS transporter [bacterium]
MFAVSLGIGIIIPLLPIYADELGAGAAWAGLIFGINAGVRVFATPVFGRLADVSGKKRILLIGLGGFALAATLMGMASQYWHLFALRAVQGLFSAMVLPVARAYAGALARRGREGSLMGVFNVSLLLGHAAGPLLGGALADAMGLRAPFFSMGLLSLVSLAMVQVLVPEQPGWRARDASPPAPFRQLLGSPTLVGVSSGWVVEVMGRGAFAALFPLLARNQLGLTATEVGLLVSLQSLAASALQPVTGYLADRWDRKRLALAGLVLMPLGVACLPLVGSFAGAVAIVLVLALSSGTFFPSTMAMVLVEGRKYGMGSSIGMIEMSRGLGMALGSMTGGALAEWLGLEPAFLVLGGMTLMGVAPFLWYLRGYGTAVAMEKQGAAPAG